jgi:phosphate transport system protein
MAELRLRYHQQLEVIEGKVIQLFALVAEGLAAATDAVLTGDRDAARVLHEREAIIDALYRDAEDLVVQQLALQAPAAKDLRFLLSVLRVVPELERSHDLVEHIARRAGQGLREELTPRARGLIERMGNLGAEMWRETGEAWRQRNGEVAFRLDSRDEEMDGLHAALTAELGAGAISLPVAMDMALVARFYERLGDHAVNVARRVTYLAGTRVPAPPGSSTSEPSAAEADAASDAR